MWAPVAAVISRIGEHDQHAGDRRALVGDHAHQRAEGRRVQAELHDPEDAEDRGGVGAGDAVAAGEHGGGHDRQQADQPGQATPPSAAAPWSASPGRTVAASRALPTAALSVLDQEEERHAPDGAAQDTPMWRPSISSTDSRITASRPMPRTIRWTVRQLPGAGCGVRCSAAGRRTPARGASWPWNRHGATIGILACELQRRGRPVYGRAPLDRRWVCIQGGQRFAYCRRHRRHVHGRGVGRGRAADHAQAADHAAAARGGGPRRGAPDPRPMPARASATSRFSCTARRWRPTP